MTAVVMATVSMVTATAAVTGLERNVVYFSVALETVRDTGHARKVRRPEAGLFFIKFYIHTNIMPTFACFFLFFFKINSLSLY